MLDTSVVDDFVYGWNTEDFVDHIIVDIAWGVDSCSSYPCRTAILDLRAQPHNSMPCVNIGVMMDLYSGSLLSTER